MKSKLEELVGRYRALGIDQQLDYDKFYLYSIITHSTAIEGSTITELENQIMFDNGIALKGKSIIEQNMNLDLKAAYERALVFVRQHSDVTVERLKELSALTMKNTGAVYHTMLGDFSSANGDLRLLNVTAGVGGKSYMSFNKVPSRLTQFCDNLNALRGEANKMSMQELYDMSFDAHFNLVTIHPWADGNGRMARLMMNWLQFEYGLIPSRIFADDKEEYIKALVETRESENLGIFRNFMTDTMIRHLTNDIAAFEDSIGGTTIEKVKLSTADRIISLINENPRHSAKSLAEAIGISAKGIEKQLAKLKAQGVIRRIGPDKGGSWEVVQNADVIENGADVIEKTPNVIVNTAESGTNVTNDVTNDRSGGTMRNDTRNDWNDERNDAERYEDVERLVLDKMRADKRISVKQLSNMFGKSKTAMFRIIDKLKADGKIRRAGSEKSGTWEVIE